MPILTALIGKQVIGIELMMNTILYIILELAMGIGGIHIHFTMLIVMMIISKLHRLLTELMKYTFIVGLAVLMKEKDFILQTQVIVKLFRLSAIGLVMETVMV